MRVERLGMPLRPTNRATPSAGMMRERRPMPHSLRANRAQLAGIRPELRRLSARPARSRRARSGVNRNRPPKAHVRPLPVPPGRLRSSCAARATHYERCAGHPAEEGTERGRAGGVEGVAAAAGHLHLGGLAGACGRLSSLAAAAGTRQRSTVAGLRQDESQCVFPAANPASLSGRAVNAQDGTGAQ